MRVDEGGQEQWVVGMVHGMNCIINGIYCLVYYGWLLQCAIVCLYCVYDMCYMILFYSEFMVSLKGIFMNLYDFMICSFFLYKKTNSQPPFLPQNPKNS